MEIRIVERQRQRTKCERAHRSGSNALQQMDARSEAKSQEDIKWKFIQFNFGEEKKTRITRTFLFAASITSQINHSPSNMTYQREQFKVFMHKH